MDRGVNDAERRNLWGEFAAEFRAIADDVHDAAADADDRTFWDNYALERPQFMEWLKAGAPLRRDGTPDSAITIAEFRLLLPAIHERIRRQKDRKILSGAVEISPVKAAPEGRSVDADGEPTGDEAANGATLTWQEAAERMERLRTQGEPFTTQRALAKQFRCSNATINKAIKATQSLQAWAKVQTVPKARSLNVVVADSTAQNRELAPEDEAAIREFIETAGNDKRAWFLALSQVDQLAYLNDPDANPNADDPVTKGRGRLHKRILNRTP